MMPVPVMALLVGAAFICAVVSYWKAPTLGVAVLLLTVVELLQLWPR